MMRYVEKVGRVDDILRGTDSLTLKMAVYDRYLAESMIVHHMRKQGRTDIPEIEYAWEQLERLRARKSLLATEYQR